MFRARHKRSREGSFKVCLPAEYFDDEEACEEGKPLLRFATAVAMTVGVSEEKVFRRIVSYV